MVEGGPNALTVDAVVVRSGVARSTIYRHWPSRDDLLACVIEACAPHLAEPDPDMDVETALRFVMRSSAKVLRETEWARMLPAFMMLRRHEDDIRAINERMEIENNGMLATLIERAAREGLIESRVVVAEAIAHLQGPVLMAHLAELMPIDDRFTETVVDRFLAAFPPSAPAVRPPASP